MHEFGTVIALKESLVQVEIPRSKYCRGCHACTPLDGKDSMMLFALNDCQADIGDQVQIQIQESGELSASLLLYGIPLAVFLISLVLFTFLSSHSFSIQASKQRALHAACNLHSPLFQITAPKTITSPPFLSYDTVN